MKIGVPAEIMTSVKAATQVSKDPLVQSGVYYTSSGVHKEHIEGTRQNFINLVDITAEQSVTERRHLLKQPVFTA